MQRRRSQPRVAVGAPRAAVLTTAVALGLAALLAPTASAAPAACNGIQQITDASGDGHHASTDVLGGWFSEASGHLQAVIRTRVGGFTPEHDDAELNGSAFVFLFTAGGRTAFVRLLAPPAGPNAATYDYGTYTAPNTFTSEGATSGSIEPSQGAGTVTIDVPAALGLTAGMTAARPFVLTYDGITGGIPDWVDHAPGGTNPTEPAFGADYVVGSCIGGAPAPGGSTSPGGAQQPGTSAPIGGAATLTAIQLTARARLTGGGTTKVSGRIVPAQGGVPVTLTRSAKTTKATKVTTAADGTFSARIPIGETTLLRATAGGIGSQTLTVTVRAQVRIAVHRRAGGVRVGVTVRPALPGRVLLLRTTSATPSASKHLRSGTRLSFDLQHPTPGRYQAVFIPSGDRAERATSNTGTIR